MYQMVRSERANPQRRQPRSCRALDCLLLEESDAILLQVILASSGAFILVFLSIGGMELFQYRPAPTSPVAVLGQEVGHSDMGYIRLIPEKWFLDLHTVQSLAGIKAGKVSPKLHKS